MGGTGNVYTVWENNGNGNKCLAGVGMGLKLIRMGRNGKLRAIPAQLHSSVCEFISNRHEGVVDTCK